MRTRLGHAEADRVLVRGLDLNDELLGTTTYTQMVSLILLGRRATEGGSWHVRVSLSQTSMWYVRLGHELDRSRARGLGDPTDLLDERDTAWGRLAFVRPPLRMSETPPRWELPAARLGSSEPVWRPRSGTLVAEL